MPDERRFCDGGRYAELFETQQGLVIVEGLVKIAGGTVELSDLLIGPFEAPVLRVGVAALLRIRRELLLQVRAEGYTKLHLLGLRVSGVNPNRPVLIRRRT